MGMSNREETRLMKKEEYLRTEEEQLRAKKQQDLQGELPRPCG